MDKTGKNIISLLGMALLSGVLLGPVGAQEAPAAHPDGFAPIETDWDSLWGMKYLQNGEELSGPRLKSLLVSANDAQTSDLLSQSESDDTLGILCLGASVAGSAVCLVIPGTVIHAGTLDISLPYLPVQIPALALGVAASVLSNAGGAAKYAAVQRYNKMALKPGPLTWNLTPEAKGLALGFNYAF